MNLYIIAEGRRTEIKVYPRWLKSLLPTITRVDWAFEAKINNYFIFNGNGYPSLLHNHFKNSIEEVNNLGTFDYLVLILDVDESTVDERKSEVITFIQENNLTIENAELVIIAQNRCIETWFLGNPKIFKKNPDSPVLKKYIEFYNVKTADPELMGIHDDFNTHSQFHFEYCREFLRERNIRYSKINPNSVTDPSYLESLIERNRKTSHIQSFGSFLDFCQSVNNNLVR